MAEKDARAVPGHKQESIDHLNPGDGAFEVKWSLLCIKPTRGGSENAWQKAEEKLQDIE